MATRYNVLGTHKPDDCFICLGLTWAEYAQLRREQDDEWIGAALADEGAGAGPATAAGDEGA
jgi:hypothetical protein